MTTESSFIGTTVDRMEAPAGRERCKTTRKTPRRDIEIALKRAKEVI
jgi:hypothetical protein